MPCVLKASWKFYSDKDEIHSPGCSSVVLVARTLTFEHSTASTRGTHLQDPASFAKRGSFSSPRPGK